jgi:hypothetical protein
MVAKVTIETVLIDISPSFACDVLSHEDKHTAMNRQPKNNFLII